jgi:ectoine hydroxylase-related dioxygenase (phytanoyl-CoA dioxygenase family)
VSERRAHYEREGWLLVRQLVDGKTVKALLKAYDSSQTNEGVFDETHRTVTPLEPGDAVFFHPMLAHGSGANRSERPRRLVTLWFVGQPLSTGA